MSTTLGPSPDQRERMRQKVLDSISATPRRVRLSRPRFAIALAGAAAIALAAAIVITPSLLPHGASPAAASALHEAAVATIGSSDPVVGTGQYLRIATEDEYISYGTGAKDTREAWLNPTKGTLYIPADRTAIWVWERHDLRPTTFFSEEHDAAMDAFDEQSSLTNGVFRAKGGAFYGGVPENKDLSGIPRDPQKLRDYFYAEYQGGSNSIDEDVWVRMTDLLRTGTVPADLRAAIYRAMALVPGVELVDGQATLNGQTGIAIGRTEAGRNFHVDVIIDPATGLLIGERQVTIAADGQVPANTVIGWSSVSTSVVDSAP